MSSPSGPASHVSKAPSACAQPGPHAGFIHEGNQSLPVCNFLCFCVITDFCFCVPWHFPVQPSEVVASSAVAVADSSDDTPLTEEQEAAVDLASRSLNVLLTGPGCTGKSMTINRIYPERCWTVSPVSSRASARWSSSGIQEAPHQATMDHRAMPAH